MGWAETRRVHRACPAAHPRSVWESNGVPHVLLPIHRRRAAGARRGSWHATNAESPPKAPRAPATGARAVSPRPERQADAVAFLVEHPVVHEVANPKQPAPI